jgi:hypothetical protein
MKKNDNTPKALRETELSNHNDPLNQKIEKKLEEMEAISGSEDIDLIHFMKLTIEVARLQKQFLKKNKGKELKEEWDKIERQTKVKMIEILIPSSKKQGECSLSRSTLTNIREKTTEDIFAFLSEENKETTDNEVQKKKIWKTEVYNYVFQITKGMFEKKMSDKKNGENYRFSDKEIEDIYNIVKEKYPALSKGKVSRIQSKKFQEEFKKIFLEKYIPKIVEEMSDVIFSEFNWRDKNIEVLGSVCDWLDDIIERTRKEIVKTTANISIIQYLEGTQNKKNNESNQKDTKRTKQEEAIDIPSFQYLLQKERNKDKDLEGFLAPLLISYKNNKDISKAITRYKRNGKSIKADTFCEQFNISSDFFSQETKEQLKKLGVDFYENNEEKSKENNGNKKNGTHNENDRKDKKDEEDLEPIEKTKEECIKKEIQKYLEKNKEWDGEVCTDILNMAGYRFNKDFIKQFTLLYPNTHMQKKVIEELTKEITNIHRKTNKANNKTYRSINFRNDHRILFFSENIIDGIYNHNDYMRRLDNQK